MELSYVRERRMDLYTRCAPILVALDDPAGPPGDPAASVAELRRTLLTALPFLTQETVGALEALEGAVRAGSPAEATRAAARRLHAAAARMAVSDGLEDPSRMLGLEPPARPGSPAEALEAEARGLLAAGKSWRAIRAYRRAIAEAPRKAALYNDLGAAYAQSGREGEATVQFRRAIELNLEAPLARTREWTTAYYNLARSIEKLAEKAVERRDLEHGIGLYAEAQAAFRSYCDGTPEAQRRPNWAAARKRIEEELSVLKSTYRSVTGKEWPEAPVGEKGSRNIIPSS